MYFLFFFFFLPFFQRFALTFQSSSYGGIEELLHSGKTKTAHILLTRPIAPALPASYEQQTQPFVGHSVGFFFMISHMHMCSHKPHSQVDKSTPCAPTMLPSTPLSLSGRNRVQIPH